MKRRLFVAGTAALAAAAFALTGCADTSKPNTNVNPPASSAPAISAKEAFSSALKKLNETSSKAEMSMDGMAAMKGTAVTDPAGKKAHATNEVTALDVKVKTEIISVNGEVWVKMSGVPGLPDKWMHVAADKVKAGGGLDISKDSSAKLESAVVTVERDGETGFKGTLDMSKAGTANEEMLKQLGDKAKAVPFTATVDAKGRVTSIVIDMTAVVPGTGKLTTTYSGFGDPVTVTPPAAGDVVEMPAQFLDALNKASAS
ncbi:MAG TPA: hypothetical protein VFC19_24510 [Candidatus Limnocylindrales bacterium]|nr:hypothetical protein [Candidatus Limnocylindrales bacterium]